MDSCKQCGNDPWRGCGNVRCLYGQNAISVEENQQIKIDMLVEIIEDLKQPRISSVTEHSIEDVPEDTWVLVTLTSTIHPEEKVYEVARLDTEYHTIPTWVCQHDLALINLLIYEITGWRQLPS